MVYIINTLSTQSLTLNHTSFYNSFQVLTVSTYAIYTTLMNTIVYIWFNVIRESIVKRSGDPVFNSFLLFFLIFLLGEMGRELLGTLLILTRIFGTVRDSAVLRFFWWVYIDI